MATSRTNSSSVRTPRAVSVSSQRERGGIRPRHVQPPRWLEAAAGPNGEARRYPGDEVGRLLTPCCGAASARTRAAARSRARAVPLTPRRSSGASPERTGRHRTRGRLLAQPPAQLPCPALPAMVIGPRANPQPVATGMVGAVRSEVAQGGELGLNLRPLPGAVRPPRRRHGRPACSRARSRRASPDVTPKVAAGAGAGVLVCHHPSFAWTHRIPGRRRNSLTFSSRARRRYARAVASAPAARATAVGHVPSPRPARARAAAQPSPAAGHAAHSSFT
ncbi:Uncharacterised protein [Streptomyces griseus]|nr:hypothetical protein SAMN04490359_2434 [Streptomyces griseus]SQA27297.1 Uncharacterised protein [Streptomyces griseus]